MATKTISITEEAYERLKIRKNGSESFTDVINKITGKRPILDFAGMLTDTEASELKSNIAKARKLSIERAKSIERRLQ